MDIDTDLLFTWGAVAKKTPKNCIIFYENDPLELLHLLGHKF